MINQMTKPILIFLLFCIIFPSHAEVIPIKNITPHSYNVSKQEVVWMYTMRKRFWDNGSRITVFYQDLSSQTHREFCRSILGMNPDKFDQLILSYINTGNAAYFRLAQNSKDVKLNVEHTPGSIGYIENGTILINERGQVNEIKISL